MSSVFSYICQTGAMVVVFVVVVLIFIRIQTVRRKFAEKYVVLAIDVPKNSEKGPIGMEQIFATLHGIETKFGFLDKLSGLCADNVSFEIANIDGSIRFFIAFPERLKDFIAGQIYAQYPDVEIYDIKDYAYFSSDIGNSVGVELNFSDSDVFPIKRYPQFEDRLNCVAIDPIAGITAAFVGMNDDQLWLQIVVSPLSDKWRSVFTKCVRILKNGIFANVEFLKMSYLKAFTTRKIWVKFVFFPVYVIFWIQGLKVNSDVCSSGFFVVNDEKISKCHDKENLIDSAMDKVVRPLFEATIRIVHVPKFKDFKKSKSKLCEVIGAFKQFNSPHLNGFCVKDFLSGVSIANLYRKRFIRNGLVLNNEELATIYHLPNLLVKTPMISWVKCKKLEPPLDLPVKDVTVLGRTNFREDKRIFGIKAIDRRRHVYIIGKTGMGKSTLLENMIYSDILAGKGVGIIDPHGDLADRVLGFIPPKRINEVVLVDPSDKEYVVAFNMLENVDSNLRSIVCSGLVGIFKRIYANSWGPRLEYILRNAILALLENPDSSMLGILRILSDKKYREKIVKNVEDSVVKNFWLNEFEKMSEKTRVEAISPIQNKVGQFLSSPVIRHIVGQVKSTVDLRFAMDKGKIVIINLSKGKIGEDNSALLGAMFVTKFQIDAMKRADVREDERRDFYLYVDEFQNFATDSFSTILSEARKYRLNLTMANQYVAQMPEGVRDAVFGNVGTIMSFQVGFDDAEYISRQFAEEILPNDLVSLGKYAGYTKLLVEGVLSSVFSFCTLPSPDFCVDSEFVCKIRKVSRERFCRKISFVNEKIKKWSGF